MSSYKNEAVQTKALKLSRLSHEDMVGLLLLTLENCNFHTEVKRLEDLLSADLIFFYSNKKLQRMALTLSSKLEWDGAAVARVIVNASKDKSIEDSLKRVGLYGGRLVREGSHLGRNAVPNRFAKFDRQATTINGISIDELLDLGIITQDQYMQIKQLQRSGLNNIPKVGDILVGHNNWNGIRSIFYQVLEVSKSFKTITVVELETNARGINSPAGGTVTPIPNSPNGRPMKKKVNTSRGGYTFTVDKYVGEARIWDGTPQPYEID